MHHQKHNTVYKVALTANYSLSVVMTLTHLRAHAGGHQKHNTAYKMAVTANHSLCVVMTVTHLHAQDNGRPGYDIYRMLIDTVLLTRDC